MKCGCIEELICWAKERGITPEDLDGLMHEFKAAEASDVNNGGLEAQLEYLLGCCGSVQELQEALGRKLGLHPVGKLALLTDPCIVPSFA